MVLGLGTHSPRRALKNAAESAHLLEKMGFVRPRTSPPHSSAEVAAADAAAAVQFAKLAQLAVQLAKFAQMAKFAQLAVRFAKF